MPSIGSMPAFDRKRRDVRIVLMPHRSIAVVIASRPAVKFRLTGTLPASDSPSSRARRRPTPAAARRRSISSGSRRRTQRDSSSAATSARPNVSGVVVASAIANDHQLMFRGPHELTRRAIRRPVGAAIARSQPSVCSASRASAAVVVDGSGAPNATVTGYGTRTGHFQKKRPPLKLKMLPQTRSR